MENFNERKTKLLASVRKLVRAIDDEIDWHIASFSEKDARRKALARNIYHEKQKDLKEIAKEEYERFKK